MRPALKSHDVVGRTAVSDHRGTLVKMTGDGMLAVFDDPLNAIAAVLQFQLALADIASVHEIALRARCGLHVGVNERRDKDFFGREVNRAARIMSAAHGGQVLVSEAVAVLMRDRLPAGLVLRDLGAVRLPDLKTPERLYQLQHPQLRDTFPALRSLETVPNNLPQQVTSFVGRDSALDDADELLRGTRLLTLFGTGGIGKTRLSLQVANRVLDRFPDGVWFVELAPLSDQRLVLQAIASALGVKEDPGRPLIDAVLIYVRARTLLVVLDNCEHLVAVCAELVHALLQASSGIRILASSREPLHVAGEVTYPVPSLPIPDVGASATYEHLAKYESVRLFVDRAMAARPSFSLNERTGAAIAEICRRLDGIPLAIELAAARVRSMSLDQIASRLSDRLQLLTHGARTSLPRQQTLRALIDWSYELLDDRERALWRSLAVFAGGLTIEAAEAVAPDAIAPKSDVMDLLTRLVEKSLVVLDAERERYGLLDTIREYASHKLEAAGETRAARDRHRDYFIAHLEEVFPHLFGEQRVTRFAHLDRELDNVLVAHAYCLNDPICGGERDLRLVHAIRPYHYNRGLLGLALRITAEALEHPGASERNFLRCRGLFEAGQLCSFMGRYAVGQIYLEESLAIAREIDDGGRIAAVLQPLGMAALGRGDLSAARRYLDEALTMARGIGNERNIAAALIALAQFHRVSGDLDSAERLYGQAREITHKLGDYETTAIALLNLAMVAVAREDATKARQLLIETMRIFDELGSRPIGQSLIEVSAGLAAVRHEWFESARYFGLSEALAQQTGIHRDPADEAFLAPRIAATREAIGNDGFVAAAESGRALPYEAGIDNIRKWLERSEL
jgi:predicted ATPase